MSLASILPPPLPELLLLLSSHSSLLLARLPQVRCSPGSRGLRREPGRRDLLERRGERERRGSGGGCGRQGRGGAAPGRRRCRRSGLRHAPVGAVKVLVEVPLVEAPLLVGGQQAAVAGAQDGLRVGWWRGLFLRGREKRSQVDVLSADRLWVSFSHLPLSSSLNHVFRSSSPARRKETMSSTPSRRKR